jgi:hypothetical protein
MLTVPEQRRLSDLETVIERGLATFIDVGQALLAIREGRLYRATHETFASYCLERWGFSDSRGRQLIAAVKTVTAVTAAGLPAPATEREARELARLLRTETAWRHAHAELVEALDQAEQAHRLEDELERWTQASAALGTVLAASLRCKDLARQAAGLLR